MVNIFLSTISAFSVIKQGYMIIKQVQYSTLNDISPRDLIVNFWRFQEYTMGQVGLFNKWFEKTGYPYSREWNWTLYPKAKKQKQKQNSKWIKNLNVSHEIVTLLEENIGKILLDIGLSMTSCIWYQKQRQQAYK